MSSSMMDEDQPQLARVIFAVARGKEAEIQYWIEEKILYFTGIDGNVEPRNIMPKVFAALEADLDMLIGYWSYYEIEGHLSYDEYRSGEYRVYRYVLDRTDAVTRRMLFYASANFAKRNADPYDRLPDYLMRLFGGLLY